MCVQAEEYGDLHWEECSCMMEEPDACDCEEMQQIKSLITESTKAENARWTALAQAHRPYCSPEGNKNLTRMMGKVNRS